MRSDPLKPLLDRIGRILVVLELAVEHVSEHGDRLEVRRHVRASLRDAVGLACAVSREIAEDELWADLPALIKLWHDVGAAAEEFSSLGYDEQSRTAEGFLHGLSAIERAVNKVDAAQVALTAHPRDDQTFAVLVVALDDLEAAADKLFMSSLDMPAVDAIGMAPTDAALAVLTSVAARAARERRSGAARNRRGR